MDKDIRLSVSFWDHHKTIRLKKCLGYEGIEALQRLWLYAREHRPDGHLINMDNDDIAIAAHWAGETDNLIKIFADPKYPWLDKNGDHYYLHNWHKRNAYASFSEKRSEQARKAAEIRWNKRYKNQDNNAKSNAHECSKQCSENANSNAPSPTPYPVPTPYSKKKNYKKKKSEKKSKVVAERVLSEINTIAKNKGLIKRNFTQITHILARINDGKCSENDLINAFRNVSEDKWYLESGKAIDLEYIYRKSLIDKHINMGKEDKSYKNDKSDKNDKTINKQGFTKKELKEIDDCRVFLLKKDWNVQKINKEVNDALSKNVKPSELIEYFVSKGIVEG